MTSSKTNKATAEDKGHPAVAVFLRGRAGMKATQESEDFTLGHNALANRLKEAVSED